jgi:hypothetical protein
MEKTQGVLKLKRMVHIVTNDYCELWRVENTKTLITRIVAPVFTSWALAGTDVS